MGEEKVKMNDTRNMEMTKIVKAQHYVEESENKA
jgi:hypothetical protein